MNEREKERIHNEEEPGIGIAEEDVQREKGRRLRRKWKTTLRAVDERAADVI